MKKIVFALILAGSSCVVFAQVDSLQIDVTSDSLKHEQTMNGIIPGDTMDIMDNGMMTVTSDYNAYSSFISIPPVYMNGFVMRDYPTATDVRWRQEGEWWHGFYMNNGVPKHVYYNDAGQNFALALPVRQSWVPDEVVTKAVELYGPVIYDISTAQGSYDQEIYTVRIIENGQLSTIWIDENGDRVLDVHRMETTNDNAAMGSEPNDQNRLNNQDEMSNDPAGKTKMKIKTESSDGTETKTKIKSKPKKAY